jgi:hypothetical protein
MQQYEQLLKTKLGNDKYVPVGMQTIDNGAVLRKAKEAQTNNAQHRESSTQWETLEPEPEAQDVGVDGRVPGNTLLGSGTAKVTCFALAHISMPHCALWAQNPQATTPWATMLPYSCEYSIAGSAR